MSFCHWLGLVAWVVVWGCGRSQPVEFALNMEGRAPESVAPRQADAIREVLADLFGTPDQPRVPHGVALDIGLLRRASGPPGTDSQGAPRGLFRQHCVACHGYAGDGAGPKAASLDPYPRDYRNGIFKYTSTRAGAKPTRTDLQRTLLRGVPGTAMPSFAHLSTDQIDALVEYVKYLSIRGETELYLFQLIVDDDSFIPPDMQLVREEGLLPAAESWQAPEKLAAELVVVPPPRPAIDREDRLAASLAQGRQLYLAKESQCVKCHGEQGDGHGEETEIYDDWNKRKKGVTPEQTAQLARRFKLPIQLLRPRDFREQIFHGGSEPEDLYLRIYVGIKGTPMAPSGPGPGSEGVLQPDQIWHVVHYVRYLAGMDQTR